MWKRNTSAPIVAAGKPLHNKSQHPFTAKTLVELVALVAQHEPFVNEFGFRGKSHAKSVAQSTEPKPIRFPTAITSRVFVRVFKPVGFAARKLELKCELH
jgi:hypothetical protein